jgi:hypothetical protein
VSRCLPFSVAGMPTVSTTRSSASRSNSLAVPSVAAATWCTADRPICTFAAFSASRALFGSVVRSSTVRAGVAPYRWSRSCFPRNAGQAVLLRERLQLGRRQTQQVELGGRQRSQQVVRGGRRRGRRRRQDGALVRRARVALGLLHQTRVQVVPLAVTARPSREAPASAPPPPRFPARRRDTRARAGRGARTGGTRARSDARGRDPAKVVTKSAVAAAAADIVRLLHHGARSGK